MDKWHIIYTHDIHSCFQNWPRVVTTLTALKEKCAKRSEPYLLFDLGDHMDRSHHITEATMGEANIDFMNKAGYDYVTIGNNEGITLTKQQLNQLYRNRTFQVLINNLLDDGQVPEWILPYDMIQMNGKRLALIGTTAPFTLFYAMLGWQISEPFEAVQQNIQVVKDQADLVIVLSHLGLFQDRLLAEQVKGIDLILGAHTHHLLPHGVKVGDTWIHQVGKLGTHVGHSSIEFLSSHEQKAMIHCQAHATDESMEDPETVNRLQYWNSIANNLLDQTVLELNETLKHEWFTESPLSNLLAESLRDSCHTQIALVNNGQILADLPKGTVTKFNLHQICPHPINPCTMNLTGRQLSNILKQSLRSEHQHMKIKGMGFRGKLLGMLAIDGLQVQYSQVDASEEAHIHQILIGDEPLHLEQVYTIATIDMFTFGPIFSELYEQKDVRYKLPDFLRDLLEKRLKRGQLQSAKRPRWLQLTNCN